MSSFKALVRGSADKLAVASIENILGDVAAGVPGSSCAVFVGIQQMEYGSLLQAHCHGLSAFSGS